MPVSLLDNPSTTTYSRCHSNITDFNSSSRDLISSSNQTSWRLVLKQETEELLLRIPAFVILSLLMVMGVLGNILVLIVYKRSFRPSTTRVFLISMAAFDLLNCSVGIPFELAGIADDISQNIPGACKTFVFFMITAASGSISVLVFVSIDRFKRVCRPWKTQMTTRQVKWLVLLSSIIALVVSTPTLVFYGVKTEYRYGFRVYDCLIDDSWAESIAVFVYQVVQLFISVACIIVLIVIYICISCKIRKQQLKRMTLVESPFSSQSSHSVEGRVHKETHQQICREVGTCNRPKGTGLGNEGCDSIISANNSLRTSDVSSRGCQQLPTDYEGTQRENSPSRRDGDAQCLLCEGEMATKLGNPAQQSLREEEITLVMTQSRDMNPESSLDGKSLLPNDTVVSCTIGQYIYKQEITGENDSAVDSMSSPTSLFSWDAEMTEMSTKNKTFVDIRPKSCKPTDRKSSKSRSDDITPKKPVSTLAKKNSTASDGKGLRQIRASKLTMMMLAISVAFILSYLPVLGVSIFRGLYPEHIKHLLCTSRVYYACHHVLLRSYFINNAINPIIYSVFNKTFRRKAAELMSSAMARLLFFKSDK